MAKRKFRDLTEFFDYLETVAMPERHDRQIAFEHGQWAALVDAAASAVNAVDATATTVTLPRWALLGLLTFLGQQLPTLPARYARRRYLDQFERDLIDWQRFSQVWYRRIARRDDMPDHPRPKEARRQRQAFHRATKGQRGWAGVASDLTYPWSATAMDDLSVFEAVARIFAESVYAGTATEMKKSWERVTKALARGESWRYYPATYVHFRGHSFTVDATEAEKYSQQRPRKRE